MGASKGNSKFIDSERRERASYMWGTEWSWTWLTDWEQDGKLWQRQLQREPIASPEDICLQVFNFKACEGKAEPLQCFQQESDMIGLGGREVGNWGSLIATKFQSHRKGRSSGDTLHKCIWLTVLHCKFRNCSKGKFYVVRFFPTIKREWHYHIFKFRMITAAGERRQTPSRETCSVYWKHLGERGWQPEIRERGAAVEVEGVEESCDPSCR